MDEKITMLHGSGGRATSELIRHVFAKNFNSDTVDAMEDAAVVEGAGRLAMTTDSFVVKPLFYPGGDIGRLCICGTVNDLLMRGAEPKYITCGFIIEEGCSISTLEQVVGSMAATAAEAGVVIVAGDTKVVEGDGGVFINTTGAGFVPEERDIAAGNAKPGDAIIVSGTLGEHHAAILSTRLGVETTIESDNAPLVEMVKALSDLRVHTLRDVTRGGLATVLCELAEACGRGFVIEEEALPVAAAVEDFCGILGLDPLYMGNEGKLVCIVDGSQAKEALSAIRNSPYGADAAIIGRVTEEASGEVILHTAIGGRRHLGVLEDEGLPRIC